MPKIAKYFLLSFVINFIVLAALSVLFEYFDTGDDPIYSTKEAIKNLIMAIIIAGTIVLFNKKRIPGNGGPQA